jgi:two-component system, sensor histidine kinase and response regulator
MQGAAGGDRERRYAVVRSLAELPLRRRTRLIAWGLAATGVLAASLLHLGAEGLSAWHRAAAGLSAEATVAAQAAALAMDANDDAQVRSALALLHTDPNVRSVVLRDRTGQLVAAWPDSPRGDSHSAAGPNGFTGYVLDVPVEPSLARRGTLRVEGDFNGEFATALEHCLLFSLAIGAVAAALVTLLLKFLSDDVHAPVEGLLRSVRALRASDDLKGRLEESSRGEFGALQTEINGLLGGRETSESNLRAYKSEFERRVLQRTQQLDAAVAEAREAVSRAEGASRAKSDFLARMSHEIRTPLNGVLGMAELLQDSPKLDERQRRYAVVIHQSGKALLQLINDILDFSKIEAGKLELDKARFCVREMVEDALEIMAERAQSKGLELVCDIPSELDTVVIGDSLRLRQVIINLLSNAVKFTERGDITIRVRMQPGVPNADFTFEVIDTGIGIKPENCTDIFDAFVQADPSASRRYGGTGLGLAICQQLVQLMGGTIAVESDFGKGSNFHLTVPLPLDRTAAREKKARGLATTRFLVVEKSEAANRMLRQHLQSWGAFCSDLDSAQAALARLRRAFAGEFDALILDAQLPGASPTALVRAVRDIPAFAETPILMLYPGSGEPPPEARDVTGPVGWQNKPIRRSQLRNALERLLGRHEAEPQEPTTQSSTPAAAAAAARPPSPSRRVLVVEDNPVNREVVAAMLQKLDYESQLACSGKEALQMLAAGSYGVVLMDCQMPDLDGYETTRRIREWELVESRARTPIVALTANALSGEAEKCLAAGMDHYLSKPLSIEQLRAALEARTKSVETGNAAVETRTASAEIRTASVEPHTLAETRPAPHQPPVGREPQTLDSNAVERIRSLEATGKPDLFERLAAIYASSSASLVEVLRRAALTGDVMALRQAAHGLRSSSQNVGAMGLAAICQEVEQAADDSRLDVAEELVERLIREHESVLQSLAQKPFAASA